VIVAEARHLVPARRDLPHELGHVLGDPAQHEERGPDAEALHEIERLPGVLLDPPFEAIPAVTGDGVLETPDVEVVLDLDGEQDSTGVVSVAAGAWFAQWVLPLSQLHAHLARGRAVS
jgi:hypothetical protein